MNKFIEIKISRLKAGESFTTSEKGNSMRPLILSEQPHILEPVKLEDVKVDDIVFCKVRGNFYTHLVKAIDEQKGLQIGNNHGYINGWTKTVYGRVSRVLPLGSC